MITAPRVVPETVTLTVGDASHANWTSYSITSDIFGSADDWQVSMSLPRGETPASILPGAQVTVSLGQETILVGRIDTVRKHSSKLRRTISMSGRGLGGTLRDCSAPVFSRLASSPRDLILRIVEPFGVPGVVVQAELKHDKFDIEPGMTAWRAIERLCELNGCHAWFTPDGTLVIGRPDYTVPPVATLTLDTAGNTNILSLDISQSLRSVYSEVSVLAQAHGNDMRTGMNEVKARETNALFSGQGVYRPLVLVDGEADSAEHARKVARKNIDDATFNALTIRLKVRGHRVEDALGLRPDQVQESVGSADSPADNTSVWVPGQRVRLVSVPDGIDGIFFLTQRTLECNIDGQFASLTLKPDGIWLA